MIQSWTSRRDAWGIRLPLFNPDTYKGSPTDRYKYNGKEFMGDVGLYEYGFRMYDPTTARFTSVDPLAEDEDQVGFSPFAYCFLNPTNFIDPDGMKGEDPKKQADGSYLLDEIVVRAKRNTSSKNYFLPFISVGQDIAFGSSQRLFNYIPNERNLANQVLNGSILPSNYARNRYLMQRNLRQTFLNRGAYFSYIYSQLSKPLSAQKLTAISKFNPSVWGGMMSKLATTSTRLSTTLTAGAGLLGKAVLPLSIYSDFSNYQGGEISGGEFGLNTSVGLYSAYGGPPGWVIGGTYIAASAGWDNVSKLSIENQQIFINSQMHSGSYNPLLIERLKKK